MRDIYNKLLTNLDRFILFSGIPVLETEAVKLTVGGSRDIVFFLPRFVVPGIFGPTMLLVYLIISVSGGNLTPPNIADGSLQ